MNGYLLDTNIALIASLRSATLSAAIRHALRVGPTWISAISYWEVVIKSMKGKLDVGDPRDWWMQTVTALAAIPLPFTDLHVERVYHFESIHRDPFDGALIGQALAETSR